MAKKTFDLGDSLAAALGNVSDPDQSEQITYVDITLIDEDKNNFYSMDGIDELAASIELIGLQQPVRLRENPDMPGRYLLVSGHRRRRAFWSLYEENPEKWRRIAAIIEKPAASPELQELRLILANADTRRMSSADLAKQVERVQMLLYKLKEEGVIQFSGRMRDAVAEACKVSSTKLAVLKVIRENLTKQWDKLYQKNKINETVAYEIAKQPPEVQEKIYELTTEPTWLREYSVKERVRHIQEAEKLKCKRTGGPCAHADDMLRVTHVESGCHSCFVYGCCMNCCEFKDCKFVCPSLLEKQAEERKKKKEARKEELAKEKARDQALIDTARGCWERFAKLRRDQSVSIERVFREGGRYYCGSWQDDRFKEFENGNKKITPGVDIPFANIHADDVQSIIKTAELFGCSTDYLLGRTEEPQPAAPAQQTLQFRSGTPAEKTLAWCAFRIGDVDMTTSAVWWPHLEKWCFEHGASIDAECVGWYPLPDWKGVLKDD